MLGSGVRIGLILVAVALIHTSPQVSPARGHASPEHQDCVCAEVRATNGWCTPCGIGYFAGVSTPFEVLVEALDPSGHPIDVESLECAGCRTAVREVALCVRCGWGYVGDRAYASALSFHLARANRAGSGAATSSCSECGGIDRENVPRGWCRDCGSGWIAHFRFGDEAAYGAAVREVERFEASLLLAPRCETCAVASYFGSRCPPCGITYDASE